MSFPSINTVHLSSGHLLAEQEAKSFRDREAVTLFLWAASLLLLF